MRENGKICKIEEEEVMAAYAYTHTHTHTYKHKSILQTSFLCASEILRTFLILKKMCLV